MKTRYIIITALIAFFGLSAFAQQDSTTVSESEEIVSLPADSLAAIAQKAYLNDDFYKALDTYLELARTAGVSSNLYYNIGNCYFRTNDIGKAILYYERALNLDPRNSDARTNLEFVKTKLIDKTNIDEANILTQIFRKVGNLATPNGWSIFSAALFILLLGAVALYIFGTSIISKKVGFFGGIVLIFALILSLYYAFSAKNRVLNGEFAIITTPSVTISTSPRTPKTAADEAFILNQGTKVLMIDSITTGEGNNREVWIEIKADNQHRGWINRNKIEKI